MYVGLETVFTIVFCTGKDMCRTRNSVHFRQVSSFHQYSVQGNIYVGLETVFTIVFCTGKDICRTRNSVHFRQVSSFHQYSVQGKIYVGLETVFTLDRFLVFTSTLYRERYM